MDGWIPDLFVVKVREWLMHYVNNVPHYYRDFCWCTWLPPASFSLLSRQICFLFLLALSFIWLATLATNALLTSHSGSWNTGRNKKPSMQQAGAVVITYKTPLLWFIMTSPHLFKALLEHCVVVVIICCLRGWDWSGVVFVPFLLLTVTLWHLSSHLLFLIEGGTSS